MRSFVDIEGSGQLATRILGAAGATVAGASDAELRDLNGSEAIRRRLQPLMPGASYLKTTPMSEIVGRRQRSWQMGATMFVATLGVSGVLGRLGRGRTFLVIPASIALIAGAARVALARWSRCL